MRILFLNSYFPPEKIAATYLFDNLNRAFADTGFEMTVYTPIPTRGVSAEVRNEYKRRRIETCYDGKMTVRRFGMMREGHNPVLRAFRYTLCCVRQFSWAVFSGEARRCDVMFISSTPPIQGAMAALVKRFTHKPFVYNLQDIFPDSLAGTGLTHKGSLLWKIGRWIENFTYRHADRIIVISEDFKRNLLSKGVPEDKIEVIYNWVDENAVVPVARKDNPLFDEFGLDRSKFYIVYAGNLGAAQNIDIILQAAQSTRYLPDLQYLIFGSEEQSEPYKKRVAELNLQNLRILPIQPYERVSFVYGLGNAAVVSCKKGFGGIAMPSKTWSILSAGTAVLASFDTGTDMQRIIEGNDIGLFTQAEDLNAFTAAIRKLYDDPQRCASMGKRGRDYILTHLTREIGTSRFVKVLNYFAK